jgi:hypothetical protein
VSSLPYQDSPMDRLDEQVQLVTTAQQHNTPIIIVRIFRFSNIFSLFSPGYGPVCCRISTTRRPVPMHRPAFPSFRTFRSHS